MDTGSPQEEVPEEKLGALSSLKESVVINCQLMGRASVNLFFEPVDHFQVLAYLDRVVRCEQGNH